MTVNYFPFHIGDFLGGVMHMDGTEIGAYTMLIVAHYQAGIQGLPDDDKKLAQIARLPIKKWLEIRATVLEKFELMNTFWTQKKVVEVLQEIESKSDAAKAKALKRWNTDDAAASDQQCQSNAIQKPITNNQRSKEESKDKGRSLDSETPQRKKPDRGEKLEIYLSREYPETPESCPQEWGEAAVAEGLKYRPSTKADFGKLINWHFEKFFNHFRSSTKANARKSDWRRAWLNWWKTEFEKIAKQEERDELYAQQRNNRK